MNELENDSMTETVSDDEFNPNDDPSKLPVIDVRRLSHAFGAHRALVDVSFQVKKQSLHGFVGPNGAGKTTALKLICTLLRPQVGVIRVFGNHVVERVKDVRQRLGFMPDHFSMYRQMTVFEYLDFCLLQFYCCFGVTTRYKFPDASVRYTWEIFHI